MIVERKPGIYLIFCLANQRAYIGQSVNVKKRIASHQASLKRGNHDNDYLQKAYNKYNVDMFVFKPLEYPEDTTIENLTAREQYWIDQFDSMDPRRGFNLKGAGNSTPCTEETKRKISEANKGREISEEEKERLRKIGREQAELNRGKTPPPMTEEHKEKIKQANTGKKHTEETKRKMSEAHKRKAAEDPEYNKKKKPTSEETKEKLRETTRAYWERKKQSIINITIQETL